MNEHSSHFRQFSAGCQAPSTRSCQCFLHLDDRRGGGFPSETTQLLALVWVLYQAFAAVAVRFWATLGNRREVDRSSQVNICAQQAAL